MAVFLVRSGDNEEVIKASDMQSALDMFACNWGANDEVKALGHLTAVVEIIGEVHYTTTTPMFAKNGVELVEDA